MLSPSDRVVDALGNRDAGSKRSDRSGQFRARRGCRRTERASGNSRLKSRERVENKTQFRHIGKYEEQRKYPISKEECEWEGSGVEKELAGLLFYQDRCMFLTSLINEKGGEVNQLGKFSKLKRKEFRS